MDPLANDACYNNNANNGKLELQKLLNAWLKTYWSVPLDCCFQPCRLLVLSILRLFPFYKWLSQVGLCCVACFYGLLLGSVNYILLRSSHQIDITIYIGRGYYVFLYIISSCYTQTINWDISSYSPDNGSMHIDTLDASLSGSTAISWDRFLHNWLLFISFSKMLFIYFADRYLCASSPSRWR